MKFSAFYGVSYREETPAPKIEFRPTIINDIVENKDGTTSVVAKCVELIDDGLSLLNFDDFSITKLIKAGIKLKPINVKSDPRFNNSELQEKVLAFNAQLESVSDKLFNSEN